MATGDSRNRCRQSHDHHLLQASLDQHMKFADTHRWRCSCVFRLISVILGNDSTQVMRDRSGTMIKKVVLITVTHVHTITHRLNAYYVHGNTHLLCKPLMSCRGSVVSYLSSMSAQS